MTDNLRERIALALVNYDCTQIDCPTLASVGEFRSDVDRDEYLRRADAILAELRKDAVEEVIAHLSSIEPDEESAGCPATWGDFVQIASSELRALIKP